MDRYASVSVGIRVALIQMNMLTETEQHGTTGMLDRSQVQVHGKTHRAAFGRLKDTRVCATRMTTLPLHSEIRQENVWAIEWVSVSIMHDLRNPLGAVYAAAEMLMDPDLQPTQIKRLATNIFRAAGRMRELLTDLNNVARGSRPTAEMCEIGDLIVAASDAAAAIKQTDRAQILLEVADPIELPLIRSRMERVFFNLITNALDAMPSGGEIRISTRKAGNHVLVELEDTGPGIPGGIRERLFEPFVTEGKQDGLGLGLALCRQTVLDHGGDIWTEPGTGAHFVIRIPLNGAGSTFPGHQHTASLAGR